MPRDALRESDVNVLLRRVDWRFLLCVEDEPHTICYAGPDVHRALELVSETVSGPETLTGACDLAVAINPGPRQLASAAAALTADGEIYVEWSWPGLLTRRRARRRLQAAGFHDVRCYWRWPSRAGSARLWLPLDAAHAASAFLSARRGGVVSPARRLALALWPHVARIGLLSPMCAVARRRPLRETAPPLMLLTAGRRSANKVVAVALEADGVTVTKVARRPHDDERLLHEAAVLDRLVRRPVPPSGIPRPLGVGRRFGRVAVTETALRGRPLIEQLDASAYPDLARRATLWLVELAGSPAPQPREFWWEKLVERRLEKFEREFGAVVDRRALDAVRKVLEPLRDVPLVVEHRDFAPWNVLVDDAGALAVADWESAEQEGLPLLDLVYFLTYAGLAVLGALDGEIAPAYAAVWDSSTAVGGVTTACLDLYCSQLELDRAVVRPLRLLCWMVHAGSEHVRLTDDAAGAPIEGAIASSLFVSFLRADLARAGGIQP